MRNLAFTVLLACAVSFPAQGQNYINQGELAEILKPCGPGVENLPDVTYEPYVLYSSRNNSVLARNTFYKVIGDGDIDLGARRAKLVGLLNRRLVGQTVVGDTLIIPTRFDLDLCAYSPFSKVYAGAVDYEKLFIIDKSVQAWAAYESGKLARWGIVNTGAKESPTPNGRFNFNWKAEYRVSSLSPPGELWEMYWVFNFHLARGIHIHQYPMPTGGPTSHGCVRLVDDDAKWIYFWADSWKTAGGDGFGSQGSRIIRPGTTVLVIGQDPVSHPHPFDLRGRYPVLRRIDLPSRPQDVPRGT